MLCSVRYSLPPGLEEKERYNYNRKFKNVYYSTFEEMANGAVMNVNFMLDTVLGGNAYDVKIGYFPVDVPGLILRVNSIAASDVDIVGLMCGSNPLHLEECLIDNIRITNNTGQTNTVNIMASRYRDKERLQQADVVI